MSSSSGAVVAVPTDSSNRHPTDRAVLRRCESGSTMLLIPVGLLIMFLLGAIAVDSAIRFQATRQVAEIASGLANDAASAVDLAGLYEITAKGGSIADVPVDRGRIDTLVTQVENQHAGRLGVTCTVAITLEAVEATCAGTDRAFFAPGRDRRVNVDATVRATLTPTPPDGG